MIGRVSSPIFIGRGPELDRAGKALSAAISGETSLVLVGGEAGVGKSRFLEQVLSSRTGQFTVLEGACIDLGGGAVPFVPITAALRSGLLHRSAQEVEELVGAGRAELARLLPDLGVHQSADDVAGLVYGSGQGRLFESILATILRLTAAAPVALVIEDLHWADRSTLDVILFLARNLRDARLAMLMTYRSDEIHRRHPLLPFLGELERHHVERIDLERLDPQQVAEQMAAILGRAPEPDLVERVYSRSQGNAFFSEELLATVRPEQDLPSTLRDVLVARVGQLSEATQTVMRTASAAGRRVDGELLATVTGADDATVEAGLREALERQILVTDSVAARESYLFRHALVQEALYDDLLPRERVRLHSAFAAALVTSIEGEPDVAIGAEIAHHWFEARRLGDALAWSVKAGVAAERARAFPEALIQFERALEMWEQVPDAERLAGMSRVELLELAAGAAGSMANPRATAHIKEAIGLVDPAADPTVAGLLYGRLCRYEWVAGDSPAALAACRRAVELVPESPPSAARARVAAALGQVLMVDAQYAASMEILRDAVEVARAVGAREIEGHALNSLGITIGCLEDVDTGLATLAEARQIGLEVGSPDDVGRADCNILDLHNAIGRWEESARIAEEALGFAVTHGMGEFYGAISIAEGLLALHRLGRFAEEDRLMSLLGDRPLSGNPNFIIENRRAALEVARGDFVAAEARLNELGELLRKSGSPQFTVPYAEIRAELALWRDRLEDARSAVAAGLASQTGDNLGDVSRAGPLYALGVRAEADVATMARARRDATALDEALDAGDRLVTLLREQQTEVLRSVRAHAPLANAYLRLAEAEASRMHGTSDAELWATAAEALAELKMSYLLAYARWRQAAAILAATRSRKVAEPLLLEAHALAVEMGARPLREGIKSLAQSARIDLQERAADAAPSAERVETPFHLTRREREILGLLAVGRTNRDISEALFITEKTAGVHVSNILAKMGVRTRTEAAALGHRFALFAEPEGRS